MPKKGKGFELIGDKELMNLIKKLPKMSAQRRVWRGIARSGSRPIIKEVRRRMPIDQGNMKRSVRYKNYSTKYFNGMGGTVKVKQTGKMPPGVNFSNPAKASVLTNGRNSSKGDIRNKYENWFEEAGQTQGPFVVSAMTQKARKFIEKEIKKLL